MKKKIMTILVAMFLTAGAAMSQVFITNDDENLRIEKDISEIGVMVPMQNVDFDQYKYVPMGEGLMVMVGMGACYLLGKRKKAKS